MRKQSSICRSGKLATVVCLAVMGVPGWAQEPATPAAEPVPVPEGKPVPFNEADSIKDPVIPEGKPVPVDPALEKMPAAPPAEAPKQEPPAERKPVAPPEAKAVPAEGKAVPAEGKAVPAEPVAVPTGKAVAPGAVKDGKPVAPPESKDVLPSAARTQANARTMLLSLPAPRGQICDRFGLPLAQNTVGYYPGIIFPDTGKMTDSQVLTYVKQRIAATKKSMNLDWEEKDERILEHYKNRRWLPYLATTVIKEGDPKVLEKRLAPGMVLHPAYVRKYPENRLGCHWLGYVGKTRPMSTKEIDLEDPYYPTMEGKKGLEAAFEKELVGEPGQLNILFDQSGEKLSQEFTKQPKPGDNIITTIDAEFQRICETMLRREVKRGAFVIVDVKEGDILALASWPTYDLNQWVPSISEEAFAALNNDRNRPQYSRAFQGTYPPASTFKVVTALAGLESGKTDTDTHFECDKSLKIGNRYFHNWNRTSNEGDMSLTTAIARSCNTYFYRVSLLTGREPILSMASRLGYGERTGLPIGESAGVLPTDEWMLTHKGPGARLAGGDVANMSIGQGYVEATPLQVARAMAGLANGKFVPKLRLVKQIQDYDNNITKVFPPAKRNDLDIDPSYLKVIARGMRQVVDGGNGTGREAAVEGMAIAGKTGTAQWGGSGDLWMAWFAGFLPVNNPRYAFAAIYEGDRGEKVSGGKTVAPIVHDVFTAIRNLEKQREDETPVVANAKRKKSAGDEDEDTDDKASARKSRDRDRDTAEVRKAKPTAAPAAAPAEEKPASGGGWSGFWKKLRGKG